jgi:hypothetical protein
LKSDIPVKGCSALGAYHYEDWDMQLAPKAKSYFILRHLLRGHSESEGIIHEDFIY